MSGITVCRKCGKIQDVCSPPKCDCYIDDYFKDIPSVKYEEISDKLKSKKKLINPFAPKNK